MIIRPRVLVVDDIVGSDIDLRAPEYRRAYCERLGLTDLFNRFGLPQSRDVVAEAVFCSGQVSSTEGQSNSLELVETVFRAGWPSQDGRYWSAVLVDMKFGDDERFGLEVVRAIHRIASEVPIVVVSSLNQLDTQIGETLRRSAERMGAQDFLAAPGVSADAEPSYQATPANLRKRLNDVGLLPDPDQVVVGTSLALCRALLALRQNIPSDAVGQALLLGESGSGKTHLAHYVRRQIAQKLGRVTTQVVYRSVLLSQKSEDMQKVQLFGTEGAAGRKQGAGVFEEAANGGLVFLDELGNLSATAQGDLLGVLQIQRDEKGRTYRSFTRDSPQPRESRCFILAATNRRWPELLANVSEALLMRLEHVRVNVPSLGERKEDLPLLLDSFVRASCARHGAQIPEVDVARTVWETYADSHSVRQLHDLVDNSIKRNPFKSLLIAADFFGSAERSSEGADGHGHISVDTEPSSPEDAKGKQQSISGLIAAIDTWTPSSATHVEDFDGALSRLSVAVGRAKLRIWRELGQRQMLVTGSLNLLSTVKRLLGRDDVAKSKPADLANQIFSEAEIHERPDTDPILAEIWDRRRRAGK